MVGVCAIETCKQDHNLDFCACLSISVSFKTFSLVSYSRQIAAVGANMDRWHMYFIVKNMTPDIPHPPTNPKGSYQQDGRSKKCDVRTYICLTAFAYLYDIRFSGLEMHFYFVRNVS